MLPDELVILLIVPYIKAGKMMRFTDIHKILINILIITCISAPINAYGAVNLEYKEVVPKNFQSTINGGRIETTSNEENGYELNVKMSSVGLDKGYYTGYIYNNQSMDLSNYDAMSFYITNESNGPIRINMNATQTDGKVFSPADSDKILIEKENSDILERVSPSYGTIELSKDFRGTVYMPFNSFREKDTGASEKITNISSWGILATLAEDEEKEFKLSKFSLINKGSKLENYFNSNFSIEGDNIAYIPVVGEGITDYKINGNIENVKFELVNPIEGVKVSNNGRLTITPDVDAQRIQISAVLNGDVREMKEILLLKSWTLSAHEVDGTSKSISKPEEMRKILSNGEKLVVSEKFLVVVRLIILLAFCSFGIIYHKWRGKKENS